MFSSFHSSFKPLPHFMLYLQEINVFHIFDMFYSIYNNSKFIAMLNFNLIPFYFRLP